MGLRFRNRIGLGAGFDKDGVAIHGWAALGLGFVELGTVTPRPQRGNPRPRLARLVEDQALVNRMGFNNDGADALARRIADARPHLPPGFVIGVNLGRNRDGDAADYPSAARTVADVADYLAINVSSPNTPGLRNLQEPDLLADLLSTSVSPLPGSRSWSSSRPISTRMCSGRWSRCWPPRPRLASSSPTPRPGARACARRRGPRRVGCRAGRCCSRASLRSTAPAGWLTAGSRSWRPAESRGGGDVREVRRAGAVLVQLWTGMVYAGPGLIGEAIDASS